MIFLIEYNRLEGRIVNMTVLLDSELLKAENLKLQLELDLHHKGIDHEVVLLQAVDENALRRTHRRYFEDPKQIANSKPSSGR